MFLATPELKKGGVLKRNLFVCFLTLLIFTGVCIAAETPQNVHTTAQMDSITVTWDRDYDADSYQLSWGKDSTAMSNQQSISDTGSDSEISFTITGLEPETTYYIELFSVENGIESETTSVSALTLGDEEPPAVPTGLSVTSLNDITENSVTLKWNDNSDLDLNHYILYSRTATSSITELQVNQNSQTVSNLTPSTRYYFSIAAVDEKGNTSAKSLEIVVDTLIDVLPPNTPESVTAILSGTQKVTVTLESGNENMVDFTGIKIHFGQNPDSLDQELDLGTALSHEFTDLPDGSTWYFAATAYDNHQNESTQTPLVPITIEKTTSFLDRSGEFEGGCFIDSLFEPAPYDVTENHNKIGVLGGYYLPAESKFKDFYGNDTYPVFLFYDLGFKYISIDLKAGYLKESGNILTVSGAPTGIKSSFTLVPVAASLNVNFPIFPCVWGFIGAGPDYWYVDEEVNTSGVGGGSNDWIGGYHGRTGLWLYNMDPEFKNWGALFEVDYSKIDRYGSNDVDLGGWMFLMGLFYSF